MSSATEVADTIARFWKDDTVQAVVAEIKQDAYTAFLHAKTDDDRRDAHAFARTLARLETAFQAKMDAGERERMDEEIAERRLATR